MIHLMIDSEDVAVKNVVQVIKSTFEDDETPINILLIVTDEGIIIDVMEDDKDNNTVITKTTSLDWEDLRDMAH